VSSHEQLFYLLVNRPFIRNFSFLLGEFVPAELIIDFIYGEGGVETLKGCGAGAGGTDKEESRESTE
tara:strand:- start:216 stop:416 length:201 start_codon:yes stop_codon:yes gene_type:complete